MMLKKTRYAIAPLVLSICCKVSLAGSHKDEKIVQHNATIESAEQPADSGVDSYMKPNFSLTKPLSNPHKVSNQSVDWTFTSVFNRTSPYLNEADLDAMTLLGVPSNSLGLIFYRDDSRLALLIPSQVGLIPRFSLISDNIGLSLKALPQSDIQLSGSEEFNWLTPWDTYSFEDDGFDTDEFELKFNWGKDVFIIIGGENISNRAYYKYPYGIDRYPYGIDRRSVYGKLKFSTF